MTECPNCKINLCPTTSFTEESFSYKLEAVEEKRLWEADFIGGTLINLSKMMQCGDKDFGVKTKLVITGFEQDSKTLTIHFMNIAVKKHKEQIK
jgi:hypothetical protein